ncbi:hypothetical protein I118_1095 [Bifidobacterium longum D2957]|nr:hypothetical protein I118_1095 [Bifidobacterium longum D2957]
MEIRFVSILIIYYLIFPFKKVEDVKASMSQSIDRTLSDFGLTSSG